MGRSTAVTVRLWAAARAAAGTGEVELTAPEDASVAWVRDAVVAALPERSELARVLSVCSVLVGDRPVSSQDLREVAVPPGAVVEFLPPFAGG